jgi:hypothetical protein
VIVNSSSKTGSEDELLFSAGLSEGRIKAPKFATNANPSQTIQFDSGPVDHGNELLKPRSAVRPQTAMA